MTRPFLALMLLPLLSGCAFALGEAAFAEAGVGIASRGLAIATVEEWGVAGRIAISEDIAAAARGVRFSPSVRGPLSESLARWSANGTRTGELTIARNGVISGSGYEIAQIAPDSGIVYSPSMRLGFVSKDGTLFEYLRSGGTRPIGLLRGFAPGRPIVVRSTDGTAAVVAKIPANGIVRVSRVYRAGYLVRLESGVSGWVASDDLTNLALLGLAQASQTCGQGAGAVVTNDNQMIEFDHCRRGPQDVELDYGAGTTKVPGSLVAVILHGGVITDRGNNVRHVMLASLARDGIIFPPAVAYSEFPLGYGPAPPDQAPDFGNVPLGYGDSAEPPSDLENVPQCIFNQSASPFPFSWRPSPTRAWRTPPLPKDEEASFPLSPIQRL